MSNIGPYRVVRKMGEGGMAVVYEGIHEAIERRVAIKVLHSWCAEDPDITQRFFNEARAVNIVNHPGLVQISDFGRQPDGSAYIVMEYLDGETLSARLHSLGGRLPIPEAVWLVRQVAAALAAAHEKGIIHRDLKPENLMIVPDPDPDHPQRKRVKILDFGLAKVARAVSEHLVAKGIARGTPHGQSFGTPLYMSPEQCRDAADVDGKADVYSLGVIFYEILAGRVPFSDDNPGVLMSKHIYAAPTPVGKVAPNVHTELSTLIHQILHKRREERPTMAQVVTALESLVHSAPAQEAPSVQISKSGQVQISESAPDVDPLALTALPSTPPTLPDRRWAGWHSLILVVLVAVIAASAWLALHR